MTEFLMGINFALVLALLVSVIYVWNQHSRLAGRITPLIDDRDKAQDEEFKQMVIAAELEKQLPNHVADAVEAHVEGEK